eukprot:TRINITY_DN25192_c0_g1_i1.p1 TRINITY_DN25192_c0_g1~~TRINITY_DN25192_c0_g1_i1.p1  ORF type:complete len:379 (+),score=85.24 TRINITY_DN25192_c0_g1_i1:79-1137(+)
MEQPCDVAAASWERLGLPAATGEQATVRGLAFSDDGTALIATVGGSYLARWALTQQPTPAAQRLRLLAANGSADVHAASGLGLAGAWGADRILFTTDNGWDHCARLCIVRAGHAEVLPEVFGGHRGEITSVALPPVRSPCGKGHFITAARDRLLRIWRVGGGGRCPEQRLGPLPRAERNAAPRCVIDPTGLVVAGVSGADRVTYWDRRMAGLPFAEVSTGLPPHPVDSLDWSDGDNCIVASGTQMALVSVTGSQLMQCWAPGGGQLSGAACLTPCCTHVARAGRDGGMNFYSLADFADSPAAVVPTASLAGHAAPLLCCVSSPVDWLMAAAARGYRRDLLLWSWPWRRPPVR